jgi:hypothetical protein
LKERKVHVCLRHRCTLAPKIEEERWTRSHIVHHAFLCRSHFSFDSVNLLFVCCSCCLWASRLITYVSLGSLCVRLWKKISQSQTPFSFLNSFFFLEKKRLSIVLFYFSFTRLLLSHTLSLSLRDSSSTVLDFLIYYLSLRVWLALIFGEEQVEGQEQDEESTRATV